MNNTSRILTFPKLVKSKSVRIQEELRLLIFVF